MEKERKRIFIWELVGFFVIVIFGSLLHFVFEWLGSKTWVALFSAVNESTWEHLKLAFFPAIIFAVIEFPILKNKFRNFIVAKTISFYIMPIVIVVLFYGYLYIFKTDSLFWDIFIFVFAAAVGQFASYKILVSREISKSSWITSWFLLFLILVCFLLFTYFPPHSFLFLDPITNRYGIIK